MGTPFAQLDGGRAEIIPIMSWFKRAVFIAAVITLFSLAVLAAKQFVMPRPQPAAQYPAHDAHPMEKVAIAADPYDTRDKQKALFVGDYLEKSFLPVFLVITNDSDKPVTLLKMKLDLLTRDRAKAVPADDDDLYRRFSNTNRYQNKSTGSRKYPFPIPIPSGDKGAVKKDLREEFDAAGFHAQAVEPHGTQAGFVFFDIGGLQDPARGATLTITGVRDGDGNDLMYFEIPLDKYVNDPKPVPDSH